MTLTRTRNKSPEGPMRPSNSHRDHRPAALGILVALTVAISACGTTPPSANGGSTTPSRSLRPDIGVEERGAAPVDGGAASVAIAADTNSWNPFSGQWSASSYLVANAIYDPLTALASDGTPHPYLAKSVTSDPDFKIWTIELRPNVVFHNGELLDSKALKTDLDAARTQGLTSQALTSIASVDVTGPLSVAVAMKSPWATFDSALATQAGYVIAPAMVADAKSKPIGTGPFSVADIQIGSSIKTAKNQKYWQQGLPHLDAVRFDIVADTNTRTNTLRSGSADLIEVNTAPELSALSEEANAGTFKMVTNVGSEADETIIALNTAKEPFDDPLARQAIAYGLDQDQLSQSSYEGVFPAARGPFSPDSPFYLSPEDAGYPKYDLAKAKDLVKQYEQKHGKPLSFTALVPPDPAYLTIAQALQQQAKDAGVDVQLKTTEVTTLITSVLGGNYQASGFLLYSSPTLDRAYPFIGTKPVREGLSLNFTRNLNPRITAAMDDARATRDRNRQIEDYRIVQREMAKDLDKIFMVHAITALVSSTKLHGVGAQTFPGTNQAARAGLGPTTPFLTSTWLKS